MIDSNSQFFATLTSVGEAKQANATALGIPWTFKEMAVGDANGSDPVPNKTQTKLINEWRRAPVNQVRTDPANPNVIITEQVIPPDVGGHWLREIGLFDADGDLVAVANCAPTFKPLLAQGTGKTQIIRMNFIVSNTAQIVLKIDPSVVLATREYVDNAVIEALAKLDFKHSALVATTANIALSGIQTIDGVLLPADARVLVKNQSQSKDNGLYVVSSTGIWPRAQDADSSLEVTPGLFVSIEKGTVNGDSVWQLVTDGPIVLGTTPLAFEMTFGRTGFSAGSYANVAVDKYGRVIAGTNPSTLAGHGIIDTYTKPEIEALLKNISALPVGTMVPLPKGTVPAGFLEVDGSVQSVATYPDLAAYLGTTFNKGDEGAGSFRLPDSRGEFLRGWDHGRGVDAGRAVGSYQADELKSHTHAIKTKSTLMPQSGSANNCWAYEVDTQTGATGGSETRPRNLAVMWCIRAWSAPVNQGTLDVAALALEVKKQRPIAIAGGYRGLVLSASGLSPLVNVTAEQLIVGAGEQLRSLSEVNLNFSGLAVGANGLDSGELMPATWYSVWVIWNDNAPAGLLSLSPTAPKLPTGYTHKARVGWIKTDATVNRHPLNFIQSGKRCSYRVTPGSNVSGNVVVSAGVQGNIHTPTYVAIPVANFVPPTADIIHFAMTGTNSTQLIAPNDSYGGYMSLSNQPLVFYASSQSLSQYQLQLEGTHIYRAAQYAGDRLTCLGWEDNL